MKKLIVVLAVVAFAAVGCKKEAKSEKAFTNMSSAKQAQVSSVKTK